MKLTCHKCHHAWDEPIPAGQSVVMCPQCYEIVPLVLAGRGQGSGAGSAVKTQTQVSGSTPPTQRPSAPPAQPQPSTIIQSGQTTVQSAATQAGQTQRPQPLRSTPSAAPTLARQPQSPAQAPVDGMTRPAVRSAPPPAETTRVEPATGTIKSPSLAQRSGTTTNTPPAERTSISPGSFGDQPISAAAPPPQAPSEPVPSQPLRPAKPEGSRPTSLDSLIGKNIGGYVIEKLLGAGGMGAVFQARQVSLERDVAFKVLAPRYADNPDFLARFTREALSAAQLNHHNIVQVYDVGAAAGLSFITMEFVRGESLGAMIKRDGRLRVDDAAAYILQAARGLKYAHDLGIIHRDIKPDNLMLNEHGVIKIADMGLAKRVTQIEKPMTGGTNAELMKGASAELTMANVAMGTPAYMSPEQARDASHVDARADQYSLGCTLYYLCAGRAPYSGTTAFELISKHMREPLTPLEVYVTGVPPALNVIISKMLEKDVNRRYPDMGGVVRDLEAFLGVESEKGPYTPREIHLKILEDQQSRYYTAASAKRKKLATTAFFAAIPVLLALSIFMGSFPLAGGILGLAFLTPLAHFILNGIKTKDYLFRRVRSVFFHMPPKSWVATVCVGLVALAVLYVLGWLWAWIGFAVLGVGLAIVYERFFVRPVREERARPIEQTQKMLKELRVRGVSEEALQNFVCRFGGEHWEQFFEDLFGYEAMVLARGKWADTDKVKPRKRFATWRDPIARWLDGVEEARKNAKNRRELARVEAKRLKATGVSEQEAEKQAQEAATRIMSTVVITPKERAKEEEKEKAKIRALDLPRRRFSASARMFQSARTIAGVLIILAWAGSRGQLPGVTLPAFIYQLFDSIGYYNWGLGSVDAGYWSLLAGIALLMTGASGRIIPPAMVTIGTLMIIVLNGLVRFANQPALTVQSAFYIAGGLILGGLALSMLNKIRGRDF